MFQQIMQATGIKQMENQLNFLKSVPLLSTFPHDILAKISDVLELEVYKKGKTNSFCAVVVGFTEPIVQIIVNIEIKAKCI